MFRRGTREQDPFGALKDGGTYSSAREQPRLKLADRLKPAAKPQRPRGRLRPRRAHTGVVIALAVVAWATLQVLKSDPSTPTSSPQISVSIPQINVGLPSSSKPTPTTTVASADYLTPDGLRVGLGQVAKLVPRAQIYDLNLAAGSLDADVLVPSGRVRDVDISDGSATVTAGSGDDEHPLTLASIQPQALTAIGDALTRSYRIPADRISDLYLSWESGLPAPNWVLTIGGGQNVTFSAGLDGTDLTRYSN